MTVRFTVANAMALIGAGLLSANVRGPSSRTGVRNGRNGAMWSVVAVAVLCAIYACGGGRRGEAEFGDSPLSPSSPPPGLDTGQKVMTDGAGDPGPVRVRLLTVKPAPNSHVVGTPEGARFECRQFAPFSCFEFVAEVCMDAVSNPTDSNLLNRMIVIATFSADGTNPILRRNRPVLLSYGNPPDNFAEIQPGVCETLQTRDTQPPYPPEGVPRFFMLAAVYGARDPASISIDGAACPTPAAITTTPIRTSPACAFRTAYDLGYRY